VTKVTVGHRGLAVRVSLTQTASRSSRVGVGWLGGWLFLGAVLAEEVGDFGVAIGGHYTTLARGPFITFPERLGAEQ